MTLVDVPKPPLLLPELDPLLLPPSLPELEPLLLPELEPLLLPLLPPLLPPELEPLPPELEPLPPSLPPLPVPNPVFAPPQPIATDKARAAQTAVFFKGTSLPGERRPYAERHKSWECHSVTSLIRETAPPVKSAAPRVARKLLPATRER